VEANEQLGFKADLRSYQLPGEILRYFDLTKVRLLSNNPEKVEAVERAGVRVTERIPCNRRTGLIRRKTYLRTKKTKMGHCSKNFRDLLDRSNPLGVDRNIVVVDVESLRRRSPERGPPKPNS